MLINNAIKFARQAYNLLEFDEQKKVYALNQILYYMVEGSPDKEIKRMNEIARELTGYKKYFELWQYRYDDTIARYQHRIVLKMKDKNRKLALFEQAIGHINEAFKKSHGDQEVRSYKTELETDYTAELSKLT